MFVDSLNSVQGPIFRPHPPVNPGTVHNLSLTPKEDFSRVVSLPLVFPGVVSFHTYFSVWILWVPCRMANGLGISRTKWRNWWCTDAGLWSCHLSWWGGCSLIIRQPHMAALLVWTSLLCVFPCSIYQSHQQILGDGTTLPDLIVFACHTLSVEVFVMTVV